jgi:hypothetical protein
MALAIGALKKALGSTVNHIVNGAQITSTSFSVTGDIDTQFTNSDGYLWVDVAVTLTKGTAGTAGLTIALYKRPLNFVSTNDQPSPSTTFKSDFVKSKVVESTTSEQFILFEDIWVGGYSCEFYLENLTGVTINNTWDLDIIPFTYIPA